MRSRKWLSVFLVLSLVGVLLVSGQAFASRKGMLIIGTTDKITSLDPAKQYDYLSSNILDNISCGLVMNKVGSAEIEPVLAKSWKISKDGKVYTFYLRKGVVFSNGHPFDASVMKYSFDRVIKLKGDPSFLLSDVVAKTEVVNKYTFRVYLKHPYAPFLSVLAYTVAFPVDPKVFPANKFYIKAPPAIGPYKIREWKRDQYIVLEANPKYFGPKPKSKVVAVKFYQDARTLRLALEQGEIDVAYRSLNPLDIKALKKNSKFVVYEGESPVIRHIVFNVKIKPFGNVKVRRALALLVNRKQIVDKVFAGMTRPLYSLIPMGMWSHKDVMPKYNPTEAKKILKSLGYSTSKPLKITLWYTPSHYGSTEADVAQVLKSQFEASGMVKVNIKYAEWATYVDYFEKGTMGMFLLGWFPDYIDPDDYTWPFLASSASPSMGSFYANKKVDELLLKARSITNKAERTKLYEEVQDILGQEVPYIDLWQGKQFCVAKKGVKGVTLEPTQIFRYYLLSK